MELNQLKTAPAHDAGAELLIKDQFGKKTEFFITLRGQDSKAFRMADKRRHFEMLEARQNGKELKECDLDEMDIELIADCIVSWRGLVDNGKPVECNKENILDLFRSAPYMINQVLEFIASRRNFTKG